MSIVLNNIVVTINANMRYAKASLLVEESGREVASLQGKVSGWSQLLGHLCAVYGLTQIMIDDLGEEPENTADLNDVQVFELEQEVLALIGDEPWKVLGERIDARTEELKRHLLFAAEKTRDLDVDQGQYRAMQECQRYVEHVQQIANLRREKQEEELKRRGEELGFEEHSA